MASEISTKINVSERRDKWAGKNLPIMLPSYEFMMKTQDLSYRVRDERVSISWDGQRLMLEGPGGSSKVLYDSRPPPLPPVVVDWRANEKTYSLETMVRGFTGVYSIKVNNQDLNVDVAGDEGPLNMDYMLPADAISDGMEVTTEENVVKIKFPRKTNEVSAPKLCTVM